MPFGSLGVRPQPVVEQQIPNYAQWDWDMAGKAQKGMESTFKMTQDAQNQPLLRDKQALENMMEKALFEPKLNEMSAKIIQMKADTNYRNAMAQRALGEISTSNDIARGGSSRYASEIAKRLDWGFGGSGSGSGSGYAPIESKRESSLFNRKKSSF